MFVLGVLVLIGRGLVVEMVHGQGRRAVDVGESRARAVRERDSKGGRLARARCNRQAETRDNVGLGE